MPGVIGAIFSVLTFEKNSAKKHHFSPNPFGPVMITLTAPLTGMAHQLLIAVRESGKLYLHRGSKKSGTYNFY
jgi:hypothetical protein